MKIKIWNCNKKWLLLFGVLACTMTSIFAQVTTSALSGTIMVDNESLEGATIKITHNASETYWGTISNHQGRFNIQGLRSGGPYTVEISYMGFQPQTFTNIMIPLGEVYVLNVSMKEDTKSLATFVVTDTKTATIEKAGASMNIKADEIATLPTIHRSVEDLIRLSPQSG
ncbi:MAG: carboxypeptidase-like regulatory domain-containing protein, partial [Bacteroidales bacterium]|nr:carboxypeptidase-like regulatory domain-containing protein [Bacteroidales bacterium]